MGGDLDEVEETGASFTNILPEPVPLNMEVSSSIRKLVGAGELVGGSIVFEDSTSDGGTIQHSVESQFLDNFLHKSLHTQ